MAKLETGSWKIPKYNNICCCITFWKPSYYESNIVSEMQYGGTHISEVQKMHLFQYIFLSRGAAGMNVIPRPASCIVRRLPTWCKLPPYNIICQMAFSCKPSSDKNTCIAICYESCSCDIHILCDCEPARTTIARDVFKTKPKFLTIAFTERD